MGLGLDGYIRDIVLKDEANMSQAKCQHPHQLIHVKDM